MAKDAELLRLWCTYGASNRRKITILIETASHHSVWSAAIHGIHDSNIDTESEW